MLEDHSNIFVADASVLYKWAAFEPELFTQAMAFRRAWIQDEITIVVPAHCYTEISNTIGGKNSDFALSFLSNLIFSQIIQYQLSLEVAAIAFNLMKKYKKISFYDACYHALAIHLKGVFVTADDSYFKTTKKEKHIMRLSDYQT